MKRWTSRRSRRPAGAVGHANEPSTSDGSAPRVLLEDHDGLLLLRPPTDDPLSPADIRDLARTLAPAEGTATVLAFAEGDPSGSLWSRLSEVLDSLREADTRTVRLVMSGAGHDRPDRPAVARRIAEAWDLTVDAPDGPVLVVPGGSVFVPPGDGGWWRFAPGQPPAPLGPRLPAPRWQAALRQVSATAVDGCTVDQIPAGLVIRPVEAAEPRPGDLFHAIPADPRRPAVIVGVPWGEDVSASDVARLLDTLPAQTRAGIRLAPGGRRDLLPLGRQVASTLRVDIEVTTGLPLFAASPMSHYGIRSVLVGPDGTPRWLPFVDAVLCEPGKDAEGSVTPRPLRWFSPMRGPDVSDDGVIHLSDDWRATLTRAGLWVGPRDDAPAPHIERPVAVDGPVIDIGRTGERIASSLWPALSRLLSALTPDLRTRTTLHVHAHVPDGGRALRALAADHGVRVVRFSLPKPLRTTAPAGRAATAGAPPQLRAASDPVMPAATVQGRTTADRTAEPERTTTASAEPEGVLSSLAGATAADPARPQRAMEPQTTGRATPAVTIEAPQTGTGTHQTSTEPDPARRRLLGAVTESPPSASEPPQRPAAAASAPETPVPEAASASASESASEPADTSEHTSARTSTPEVAPMSSTAGALAEPKVPAPRPVAGLMSGQASAGAPASDGTQSGEADGAPVQPPKVASIVALPVVPVSPGHRSTVLDRNAFRTLAEAVWERHGAAVSRALAGMPALRGEAQEAARADLIAVRMYLQKETEGTLSHAELTRTLRNGEHRLVPYAACLSSGLGRLPSYRGVVLRGPGDNAGHGVGVRPGQLIRDPAPVSGVPLDPAGTSRVAGVGYAILSITGRRTRQLLDEGDEIVFPPGTAFMVLDVRTDGPVPLVLLRQLPGMDKAASVLEDADDTALTRLNQALTGRTAPGKGTWPDRCAGPVGAP